MAKAGEWYERAEFVCKNCGHGEYSNPKFLDKFFAPELCVKCGERAGWWLKRWSQRYVSLGWFRGSRLERKNEWTDQSAAAE